jgi:hypothetical protein
VTDNCSRRGRPRDPQTWNRYAYVVGDPVNQNDPSGLCTIDGTEYLDGYPPCPDVNGVTVNGDTDEVEWLDLYFPYSPNIEDSLGDAPPYNPIPQSLLTGSQSGLTLCLNAVDSYFHQQAATADAFINNAFSQQAGSLFAKEIQGILVGAFGGAFGYKTSAIGIAITLSGLGNLTQWSQYIPLLAGDTAATMVTGAVFGGFAGVAVAAGWLLAENLNAQSIVIYGVNAAYAQMERQAEQVCISQSSGH